MLVVIHEWPFARHDMRSHDALSLLPRKISTTHLESSHVSNDIKHCL